MSGKIIFHVPPKYEVTQFINEGSYGTVWQGRQLETGRTIAIKKIHDFCGSSRFPPGSPLQRNFLKKVYRELAVMKLFTGCPEFIELIDLYTDPDEMDIYIVMNFMPLSLRDAIIQPGVRGIGLEEGAVRYIATQLLVGIDRMAKHRCIHRDLSPANVLFDIETCRTAISDFGLVRAFFRDGDDLSLDVVTLPYRPPELLMLSRITDSKIDVWSVGIILVELLIGDDFVHGKDLVAQFRMIVERVADLPSLERWQQKASDNVLNYLNRNWQDLQSMGKCSVGDMLRARGNVSEPGIAVIHELLQVHPDDRISAEDALKMSWFQSDDDTREMIAALYASTPGPEVTLPEESEHLPFAEMRERVLRMTAGLRGTCMLELAYASGKHR